MTEIEKSAQLKRYITVVSAFLALMSALSSLMLTRTLNRSVLTKSEEAIVQSQIADQWAYYQSKNIRLEILQATQQGVVTAAATSAPDKVDNLQDKKNLIAAQAQDLEKHKIHLAEKSSMLTAVAASFSSAVALLQLALMLMPLTYIRESFGFLSFGGVIGLVGSLNFFYGAIELFTHSM